MIPDDPDDIGDGDDGDDGGDEPDKGFIKGVVRDFLGGLSLFGLIKLVADESTAETLAGDGGLLTNPIEFIRDVIAQWVYDTIIEPVVTAVWNTGYAIIDGIIVLGFGGDYAFGVEEGTSVGLLDVPFLLLDPIGLGALDLGDSISAGIESVNQPIVDSLATFGIAAPFVGPIFILVEVIVVVYALYTLMVAVDVPLIRVMPLVNTAVRPLKRLVMRLLGK